MILLCSSVTDFLAHYKVIYRSMRMATARLKQLVRRTDRGQEDQNEPRVSWTTWVPGTIVMIIVSCVFLYHQYDMPVETCVVSLIFGFVLAFITIQVQGMTDNSPLTAITKLSQLAIGRMTRGSGVPLVEASRINIAGAQASGGAAYAAAELIMDFRIGYLLGTPVMQQFIVQILGNVCAVFISPAIFILFAKAYPCIIHLDETGICSFLVPGAQSWSAIATAVLSPGFRIPTSAAVTALVIGGVSVALSLLKSLYWVGERAKYRLYVPNMTIVRFAMILPATCYNTVSSNLSLPRLPALSLTSPHAMTMGAIAMML
ncbi:oligopeptide transporter [Fusarium albosuccineum]|uniref:Oligopeptide transporter n=1 Tax=Fusarium albosuccineum TaxID=1237068 RepID=A0A8H4PIZ8_9HYPO|nr:oligopeptide transporter [Fusarium albosuccineum]